MDKMEALRLIYASAMLVLSAMLACVIYPPLAKTANKIVESLTR